MTLPEIKKFIKERLGKIVIIKQKISHRTVPLRYEGVVSNVYDNLFIIELINSNLPNKVMTFTYRDILTKTIELADSE